MLKNDNVVSLKKNLLTGKYFQVLKDLRRIGHPVKKAWYTQRLQAGNAPSENKFTTNPAFKKFLVDKFQNVKLITENNDKAIQPLYELKDTLLQLTLFLMLWKDDPKSKMEQLNVSIADKKRLRQQLKYKSQLDKDDRHDINIGLHVVTFLLCQEINNAINQLTPQHQFDRFEETRSKDDLIQFILLQQENFNKWLSKDLNSNNELSLLKSNLEIIEKIGKAITAFQAPNKKKKVLKYSGIALAFIAALASGLSTGAAIILLFPSLSLTAITLGGLIALFGFTANFGFLSKNFPDFLLSLSKKGGISEYIDNNGDRKQFSTTYKYLLTPLAIGSSLTVGIGATALTYITIIGLVAKFLPILAIIWPPLPLIIVGILAASVGVTLTVATLTASLELLKKLARLNMSFLNLCQFASKNCIAWFKHLKNAKTHEKVGLAIMLLLLPVGLAGLAYYRYTAGIDLSIFIGLAGAIVTGLTAYMAQVAFIFLSINKLKSALMRPFSSNTIQPADANTHTTSLLNQTQSFLSKIWYLLGLSVNAIGNSVLVYNGSSLSIAGAVACGVNSFSGNMLAPDTYQGQRNQINQCINQDYKAFITKAISNKSAQSTMNNSTIINTLFFNLSDKKSDKKIELKPKPVPAATHCR